MGDPVPVPWPIKLQFPVHDAVVLDAVVVDPVVVLPVVVDPVVVLPVVVDPVVVEPVVVLAVVVLPVVVDAVVVDPVVVLPVVVDTVVVLVVDSIPQLQLTAASNKVSGHTKSVSSVISTGTVHACVLAVSVLCHCRTFVNTKTPTHPVWHVSYCAMYARTDGR